MRAAGRVAKPERTRFLGLPAAAWWAAAVAVGVIITVVSLLPPRGTPGPQIADLGEVVANFGHFTGYLLLALSLTVALTSSHPWFVWIFVSVYGAVIELVQGGVGLRSFQVTDILVNAVGAGVGIWIARMLDRRSRSPEVSTQFQDPT